MKKIFDISEEDNFYMSGVDRDLASRKNVLKRILSSRTLRTLPKGIREYNREYIEKYVESSELKDELAKKYIPEDYIQKYDITWQLEYTTAQIEITKMDKASQYTKIHDIAEDVIAKLRLLNIDVTAMEELIAEYITDNLDTGTPLFSEYNNEYSEKLESLNKLKQEIASSVGVENGIYWTINFNTKQMFVY